MLSKPYANFIILFIVFVCCSIQSFGQLQRDSVITGALLQEDLDSLYINLLRTHQSPFTYCDSTQLSDLYQFAKEDVAEGKTLYEFSQIVALFLQQLKDSHTSINFPAFAKSYLNNGGKFLPLRVSWIDGAYILKEDLREVIPVGAKILNINNTSSDSINNILLNYSVLEGSSTVGHQRIADAILPSIGSWIYHGDSLNKIEYTVNGETYRVPYLGCTLKELKKLRKEQKQPDILEYSNQDGVAVIRIGSFSSGGDGYYQSFLKRSFRDIAKKGTEHLIIDVRENTGGRANRMALLFAYLTPDTIISPNNIIYKQSPISLDRTNKTYRGLSKFLINLFHGRREDISLFKQMANAPIGTVDTLYYREPATQNKVAPFTGKRYLIMDGMSGSASANLAGIWKSNNLGIIVGEDCLGPRTGTWGNPAPYLLPNSKLGVLISTIRFNIAEDFDTDFDPVKPDLPIETKASDIKNDLDPQMEAILEIIHP